MADGRPEIAAVLAELEQTLTRSWVWRLAEVPFAFGAGFRVLVVPSRLRGSHCGDAVLGGPGDASRPQACRPGPEPAVSLVGYSGTGQGRAL
jgi:hypothetical protein